jgi:ATP-dependent DNA helicase RecQ
MLEPLGTHHQRYRIRPLRSHERMLHGYPAAQRRLLQRILAHGKAGWSSIQFDSSELAEQLGVNRKRIVAALTSLADSGDAVMKVSGIRHAFRIKREPESVSNLADEIADVFQRRKQADLERLRDVIAFCASRGCLAVRLARHFGTRSVAPCGHCDRCRGLTPIRLQRPATRALNDDEWQMIREIAARRHAALASPVQLAKFLCGMRSPASSHAKLTYESGFGLLADLPFDHVLPIATAVS